MTALTVLTASLPSDAAAGASPSSQTLGASRELGDSGAPELVWKTNYAVPDVAQATVRATLSKPSKTGIRKVSVRCVVPVLETAGAGAYDYVAPAKIAYTMESQLLFWLPPRAVSNDRVSGLNLAQAAILQANIVELVESLLQPSS